MKFFQGSVFYLFLLFLFPLSLEGAVKATSLDSFPDEYLWITSPKEVHGDNDGYVIHLLSQLLKNPNDPYMPLVVQKIERLAFNSKVYPLVEATVPLLLQRKIDNGYTVQALRSLYGSILYRQGKRKKIKALKLERGYIKSWQLLGPFGYAGRSLLHRVFQVELDQEDSTMNVLKKYKSIRKEVSFQQENLKNPTLWSFDKIYPKEGGVYALSQVYFSKTQPLVLKITPSDSFKLWLNGSLLYTANYSEKYIPKHIEIPLYFQKGWNRLFFKLASPSSYNSIQVRILDLKGNPIHIQSEKTGKIHKLPKGKLKYYKKTRILSPFAHVQRWRKKLSPYDKMAKGILYIQNGLRPMGIDLIQEAIQSQPNNLIFLHLQAIYQQKVSFIPESMGRNQVKKIYERIQKEDPKFFYSHLFLASYYHKNDKPLMAMKILKDALSKVSFKLPLYYAMSKICFQQNWEVQGLQYIRLCEKIRPNWSELDYFWENYYQRKGNPAKAWKYTLKKLNQSKDLDYILYQKAKHNLTLGKTQKAFLSFLSLHKKHPKNLSYLREIYNHYSRDKNFAKAIEIYKKIQEKNVEKAGGYGNLGSLYLEWGKKKKALWWYKLSLKERPSQQNLRYYIRYLQNKEWDYAQKYDLDIRKYMKKAPGSKKYPKAHSLMVLDQTVLRIYEDGSTSETNHTAHKILDDLGKEKFHKASLHGDTYEIRTFDSQGKIWEPILPKQGNIIPPALGPGSVFEQKFRKDNEWGSHPFQFRWGPFFFKDSRYDEPVLFSRLVVIASNKYPIHFLQKNIKKAPKVIQKKEDTIYIWTFENENRTEIEPYMPPPSELLPYVQIYNNKNLEEHILRLGDRYQADVRLTPQVERVAKKILEKCKGKSEYEKAKALYWYVHHLIPNGRGQGESGSALKILLEKRGDRGVLFTALLKASNITYHHAYIRPPRNPIQKQESEIQRELRYETAFLLKVLPKGHAPVWVTASIRNLSFGKIPENLQGGEAFVFHGNRFYKEELPKEAKTKKAVRLHFELTLEDSGDLKGTLKLTMPGTRGASIKEMVKTRPSFWRKNTVEGITNQMFPGAMVTSYQFLNIKNPSLPFQVKSNFTLAGYIRKKGNHYELKSGIPPINLSRQFSGKANRIHDFLFPGSTSVLASSKIHLGKWKLKTMPSNLMLETKMGSYLYTSSLKNNTLFLNRRFILKPFRLKASKYGKLLEWTRKIDTQERKKLLLK